MASACSAALLCAAGAQRPPRRAQLARLIARLDSGEAFAATLAGARLESDGARAHLVRDAGDARRETMSEVALPEGRPMVWDGRFEVTARSAGSWVGPLGVRTRRLTPTLREALASLAPAARRALPVVTHADGAFTLPTLRPDPIVDVRPLALPRLAAARGAIIDERALRRMAESVRPY